MNIPKTIRVLVAIDLISLAVGLGAFGYGYANNRQDIQQVQSSRQASATKTCYLLRSLVLHATPPDHLPAATKFMSDTPLKDCNGYGRKALRP